MEDILDASDSKMLRRAFDCSHNLRFNLYGFSMELRWREGLVTQSDGQREERDESGNKPLYLPGIGKLLFEVFDLPQEVGEQY